MGPASDYYAPLASHPEAARRVGWESRLAQLARFSAVAASLRPEDRLVVDVGAGLGDLSRFLAHTHPGLTCLGLEARRAFVETAARMQPPVTLQHGRVALEAEALAPVAAPLEALAPVVPVPGADVIVAIGALVDGRPLRPDGLRLGRIRALLAALLAPARRLVVAVFACQDALERDLLRREDPALGGLRPAELPWVTPEGATARLVSDLLPGDLVVLLARDAADLTLPDGPALREAARRHPMAPTDRHAHLHFALLARERARADALIAEAAADPRHHPDAAWRLLVQRHALDAGRP